MIGTTIAYRCLAIYNFYNYLLHNVTNFLKQMSKAKIKLYEKKFKQCLNTVNLQCFRLKVY